MTATCGLEKHSSAFDLEENSTQLHCIETTIPVLRKILLLRQLEQAIEKVQNSANSPKVDKGDAMILFCL